MGRIKHQQKRYNATISEVLCESPYKLWQEYFVQETTKTLYVVRGLKVIDWILWRCFIWHNSSSWAYSSTVQRKYDRHIPRLHSSVWISLALSPSFHINLIECHSKFWSGDCLSLCNTQIKPEQAWLYFFRSGMKMIKN